MPALQDAAGGGGKTVARQTPPKKKPAAKKPTVKRTAAKPAVKPAVNPQPHPLDISEKGLEFITRFEGYRARAYNDAAAPPNATIGVGHLLHSGRCTVKDRLLYWPMSKALAVLRHDVAGAVSAVRSHVKVHVTQPQFDCLVSFTFNCGAGALAESQLLRDLNAGHYQSVPADLMHWTHAGSGVLAGLVTRRRAEGELFAHGVYR